MTRIPYLKIICLSVILFTHQGCSEDILTQTPDHVISESLVVNSVEKLQNLLTGSYNEISSEAYLGRALYKRAAVKGPDFRFVKTTYNPRNYEQTEYRYEESSNNNGSGYDMWLQCYKAIGNLNLILDNIDAAEGNDSERQQIKAEALALRGMVYFDLARTFAYPWIKEGGSAQGLPLKLTSSELVVERSSLEETYEHIISDLEAGAELIEENTWTAESTKYMTRTGIHALLARVYLYKQDWENALQYAQMVLAVKGEADLMGVNAYVFNDYTSESLFEISIDSENSVGSNGLGAQFDFREGGQGDVIATQTFVDLLQTYEGDPRAALLTGDKEGANAAFVKYINREGGSGLSIHNVPVIRLSEIYLIAAEACAHGATGGESQALVYLNMLISKRTTDFDVHKATESGEALRDRIAQERRRELALEGHGVYDFIRTGRDIIRLESDHVNTGVNANNLDISASSYKTIYPIPASEIEASGMKQTEGY
ncbi:RagB/SusD family nutrient uptake outer membrane protein [Catalinimonas niigatensis]|uniref:RagB/SusD family nutrient uptake outer membrane protein n=1 Tax=Catalinimonas niigatensis TaxID=1397264 RepID=UPI002665819C|nr:RagB/SusD family nutrient uptake outer membrane protein [Catalinimonas niigatensis]WPP49735.1 RagB/SusD family nutrient uptake outer membrane protein [Catalinimonas niigatensis]